MRYEKEFLSTPFLEFGNHSYREVYPEIILMNPSKTSTEYTSEIMNDPNNLAVTSGDVGCIWTGC